MVSGPMEAISTVDLGEDWSFERASGIQLTFTETTSYSVTILWTTVRSNSNGCCARCGPEPIPEMRQCHIAIQPPGCHLRASGSWTVLKRPSLGKPCPQSSYRLGMISKNRATSWVRRPASSIPNAQAHCTGVKRGIMQIEVAF